MPSDPESLCRSDSLTQPTGFPPYVCGLLVIVTSDIRGTFKAENVVGEGEEEEGKHEPSLYSMMSLKQEWSKKPLQSSSIDISEIRFISHGHF